MESMALSGARMTKYVPVLLGHGDGDGGCEAHVWVCEFVSAINLLEDVMQL